MYVTKPLRFRDRYEISVKVGVKFIECVNEVQKTEKFIRTVWKNALSNSYMFKNL